MFSTCRHEMTLLLVTLAAAFVLICVARTHGDVSAETAEKLQTAQQAYSQQRYEQAVTQLEALIEEQPTLAEAHRLLGHSYLALDHNDRARQSFLDALNHGRVTADVMNALIRIDRAAERPVALLGELPLMSVFEPNEPAWPRLLARTHRELDQPHAAAGVLAALSGQRPGDHAVWIELANAHLAADESRRAAKAFETAYHLGAREAELATTIARLHRQLEAPTAALPWYDRAIAVADETQRRELSLERAAMRVAAGLSLEKSDALQALAEVDDPSTARRACDLLAQDALARDDQETALQWWRQAVEHGLSRGDVLAFLGAHAYNNGDHTEAARYLSMRLSSDVIAEEPRRYLVRSLVAMGEHERAVLQLRLYVAHHGLTETARELIDAAFADEGGTE